MLRIKFSLRQDAIGELRMYLCDPSKMRIKEYPINFTEYKYRNMWTIIYGESTLTLAIGFNGTKKEQALNGFLEFNPNKCMQDMYCAYDLVYILSRCVECSVVRFDLAIDIPYERDIVHMRKDGRKYELHQKSKSDRTEYLGQRNKPGRCKLYNKQLESDLEHPLTRFEVTLGETTNILEQVNKYVPEVWTDTGQKGMLFDLKDTDRVLCELIRDSVDAEYYLRQMSKYMRKRIEPYVIGQDARLKFDIDSIKRIVTCINELVNDAWQGHTDKLCNGWIPTESGFAST